MKWREEVPLTEADYAAIRAKVMREVSVRRSPFAVRRIGFAFAALAAVLAIVVLRRPVFLRPPGQPRAAVLHGTTPQPPANGERQTANVPPATVIAHKHHHLRKKTPAAVLTATRIDIQTADPDVRIIWFAR
jgi:hypothetical protein